MILFDGLPDREGKVLADFEPKLGLGACRGKYYVNRDLQGRICLVWSVPRARAQRRRRNTRRSQPVYAPHPRKREASRPDYFLVFP